MVTKSVQACRRLHSGLSLIISALAAKRYPAGGRFIVGYVGHLGSVAGLVASSLFDLPTVSVSRGRCCFVHTGGILDPVQLSGASALPYLDCSSERAMIAAGWERVRWRTAQRKHYKPSLGLGATCADNKWPASAARAKVLLTHGFAEYAESVTLSITTG